MTRVLIVEDSPTQAEELRWILESDGFDVRTARDGASALSLLQAESFDLVITDIVMPGMSGYELCRAIKASRRHRELPVILLTTLSDPTDIIAGLECGADNFVTKSGEHDYLRARVRNVLENKRLRAEGRLRMGVEILFLGRRFNVTSDREQILDLLLSTFEDIVRKNTELRESQAALRAAKAEIESYSRQLEGQVRATEGMYRALMNHASDAIFVADEGGKVLQVNRQAEHLLGLSAVAVEGRMFKDLVGPAERDYAALQLRKLAEEGRAQMNDVRLARAGGDPVCADLSASLVETDSGRVMLIIARDVTERNRLQQQVLHNEKLATVGTLAAGIAHEINNPTAVILGNLESVSQFARQAPRLLDRLGIVTDEVTGPLGMELRRLHDDCASALATADLETVARDCTHAGERIRDIVRDLKGFSRIDDGDITKVDIHECLDTTLRMAFNEVRYRARVEKRYARHLPAIMASPGKLNQLFLNLVVNAAQAIEEGNVAGNLIAVTTRLAGASIRVDISDTGKGIPEAVRAKIFDPFFTTKPAGVGTGLGLSICHDIVKKHGGEILVQSECGRGTTISILLPMETGLMPQGTVEAPAAPESRRLRLLLIDDDASLLKLYSRKLGRHHEVATALGGRAALAVLAAEGTRFDVVLCDVMMPDVDGVDVHRYVADALPGLAPRMIFLSGGAFTSRASELLARVSNARLEKPFEMEQLLGVIAEAAAK